MVGVDLTPGDRGGPGIVISRRNPGSWPRQIGRLSNDGTIDGATAGGRGVAEKRTRRPRRAGGKSIDYRKWEDRRLGETPRGSQSGRSECSRFSVREEEPGGERRGGGGSSRGGCRGGRRDYCLEQESQFFLDWWRPASCRHAWKERGSGKRPRWNLRRPPPANGDAERIRRPSARGAQASSSSERARSTNPLGLALGLGRRRGRRPPPAAAWASPLDPQFVAVGRVRVGRVRLILPRAGRPTIRCARSRMDEPQGHHFDAGARVLTPSERRLVITRPELRPDRGVRREGA